MVETVSTSPVTEHEGWFWYAGSNNERYELGPYTSREEALKEGATWNPLYLIEATKRRVRLSCYFSLDDILDALADDPDIGDWEGDPPEVDATPAQFDELSDLVRQTIDAWQQQYGIVINAFTFAKTRNSEVVHFDSGENK